MSIQSRTAKWSRFQNRDFFFQSNNYSKSPFRKIMWLQYLRYSPFMLSSGHLFTFNYLALAISHETEVPSPHLTMESCEHFRYATRRLRLVWFRQMNEDVVCQIISLNQLPGPDKQVLQVK